jgi:hypothetical protein
MRRAGYQLLGFAVWKLAVQTLRRRFGAMPTKLAAGTVLLAVAAAVVLVLRRSGDDDF